MVTIFLVLLIGTAAAAESPEEIIRNRNDTVRRILDKAGDNVNDATRAELKDIINGFIDFRELSRLALGKYWDERTEQEKADFTEVFQKLIRNSSVKKLGAYKADKIVYEQAEITGDKAYVTTYAHKDKKEVEIIYKMHKLDGEWWVFDMEIDGASTVRNYRESFYKQIEKNSYADMYNKLVSKLEEE